jgi:hypothetical protein
MEDFGSRETVAIETCLAAVENSEVLVLLLGFAYGSMVPTYELSYTQVEYERARECGIPVLAYLRDGIGDSAANADDPVRLMDFFNEIERSHTVRRPYFTNPDELADQVAADLAALAERLRVRPSFGRVASPIEDPRAYAVGRVRYNRLQLSPLVVVLADVAVLSAVAYPEGRGRRLREKIRDLADYLRKQGVNVLIFNDIPATGPEKLVVQRANEVRAKADVVLAIVRGEADAENLGFLLNDTTARIAVWFPPRKASRAAIAGSAGTLPNEEAKMLVGRNTSFAVSK